MSYIFLVIVLPCPTIKVQCRASPALSKSPFSRVSVHIIDDLFESFRADPFSLVAHFLSSRYSQLAICPPSLSLGLRFPYCLSLRLHYCPRSLQHAIPRPNVLRLPATSDNANWASTCCSASRPKSCEPYLGRLRRLYIVTEKEKGSWMSGRQ